MILWEFEVMHLGVQMVCDNVANMYWLAEWSCRGFQVELIDVWKNKLGIFKLQYASEWGLVNNLDVLLNW